MSNLIGQVDNGMARFVVESSLIHNDSLTHSPSHSRSLCCFKVSFLESVRATVSRLR